MDCKTVVEKSSMAVARVSVEMGEHSSRLELYYEKTIYSRRYLLVDVANESGGQYIERRIRQW